MRLWDDVFRQAAVAVSAVERSRAEVQQQGVRLAGDRQPGRRAARPGRRAAHRDRRRSAPRPVAAGRRAGQGEDPRQAGEGPGSGGPGRAAPRGPKPPPATGRSPAPPEPTRRCSWAQALLGYLGLPVTSQNLTAITAWELAEGGNWFNSARFNPLDTTMPEPGATAMNGVGVKAYTSWAEGFTATIATLNNGLYGPILAALRRATTPSRSPRPWPPRRGARAPSASSLY